MGSTGTCAFTFNKVSDDICQLRLDFQTFSGFATTTPIGACSDYMTAAGQTGKDPPSICGTNTAYHMYVEFGATSTDTIAITNTYGSTTTAKTFNILARQISCTASYKAPTDCVQYFTGTAGSVKSYNYAGGQVLAGQRYNNCIRTEKGYCAIQWKESSTTSPDPFSLDSISVVGANGANPPTPAILCDTAYIAIPNLSPDGIVQIPIPPGATQAYQSQVCGTNFGIEGMGAISSALVSRQQPLCWESTLLRRVQQSLLLQLLGSIWITLSCHVKIIFQRSEIWSILTPYETKTLDAGPEKNMLDHTCDIL